MGRQRKQQVASTEQADAESAQLVTRTTPLVFVSHDTRDADLAEAFDNLLTDASGGVVKTFRSSDRKGQAGIEYGAEWFPAVMAKLNDATDVVAMLTTNSVDRPWILYEAGVAKGKLNTTVFGVALGIPLPKASVGPFAQFQNCADDAESLTKLVLQLIRRNPDASPREEAVGRQVAAFLESIATLIKKRVTKTDQTAQEMDSTTVAKLFEEVKVMFRDLPGKIGERVPGKRRRHRRLFHPMIVEELFHVVRSEKQPPEVAWLLFASVFKDDMPWFHEVAMDVYRALCSKDTSAVKAAWTRLRETVRFAGHSRFILEFADRDDPDAFMMLRHFPEIMERTLPMFQEEEAPPNPKVGVPRKRSTPRRVKA
ncbi:MAG: toll/interleukin-1 receptor domain-containing protein [Gemmatimonadales bacterium]